MHIRCMLGVLGLMTVYFCCAQTSWAQTSPDRPGASHPDGHYTLFAELHRPYESNRVKLQKMLKGEGHESFAEGEREIVLILTKEEIGKLFQARVRFRRVGASATDRMITEPYLERTRIPGRFGKLIRRVYFDPQR